VAISATNFVVRTTSYYDDITETTTGGSEMKTTGGLHHRRGRLTGLALGGLALAALTPTGGAARADAPPKVAGQPTISGRPIQGNVLTASNGSFSGTGPFNYTYRWLRCPTSGGAGNGDGCTAISGATFKRYVVRAADVGHRLRVRVTAANADGTATETSNATGVVQSAATSGPPRSTTPPTISGTPQVGEALIANNGTWSGARPFAFAYQWRRCDANGANCATISGATSKTYALTTADQGNTLRVRVTARNARGASSATSGASAVIAKAEAPSGATVSISEVSLPNRLIIDRSEFAPRVYRGQRTIVARFHVSDSRNHNVSGALVFCEPVPLGWTNRPPERATGSDGWVTFLLHPSRAVQRKRSGEIVWFLRARKEGENPLGGVTARRLLGLYIRR
jgi:hypothetical protein